MWARFLRVDRWPDAINGCNQLRTMTTITAHWRKQLRNSDRPAYLLLAELIADDIKTGRLGVRDSFHEAEDDRGADERLSRHAPRAPTNTEPLHGFPLKRGT